MIEGVDPHKDHLETRKNHGLPSKFFCEFFGAQSLSGVPANLPLSQKP